MAVYPKQLQLFDSDTGFRKGFGDEQVIPAQALDATVNVLLNILHKADHNITVPHTEPRIEARFRPFDNGFGAVTVSLSATTHTANEVITKMREAYDTWRVVNSNSFGLASSVDNT